MKLFKNVLVIIALFTIGSAFAKRTGGPARTTGTPPTLPPRTTAPALPKKQFSFLMADIRNMKQSNVINEDGDFTDSFISMVQSSGLAPAFMIELLMAGRNLYMPLSGDDEVDMKSIAYNDAVIGDFMANLEPVASVPSADSAQQPTPDFYNVSNNLLNLVWLENNIKSLLQSKSTDDDFVRFKMNTMSAMANQWQQRDIKNTQSLKERVGNQIDNMTKKLKGLPQQWQQSQPKETSTPDEKLNNLAEKLVLSKKLELTQKLFKLDEKTDPIKYIFSPNSSDAMAKRGDAQKIMRYLLKTLNDEVPGLEPKKYPTALYNAIVAKMPEYTSPASIDFEGLVSFMEEMS